MRALTLTQPWAGLVASGIKLVENRPRRIIKFSDFGCRFAIHASRVIDEDVFDRIYQIAPELHHSLADTREKTRWHELSRITSAVIAVATLERIVSGNGDRLDQDQRRWYFGPLGYVLKDVVALKSPVRARGFQGFWTLPENVEAKVKAQLEPIRSLLARSSIGAGLANIRENGIDAELADLEREGRKR